MLNLSACLNISTSFLKALPGKLDIMISKKGRERKKDSQKGSKIFWVGLVLGG